MALVLRKILSTGGLYYYYPVLNTRGDIIELHSGSGALSARYTYDSWGKLISVVDGSGATIGAGRFAHYVSLRYRGYYYDEETELYYLQSRYYDPEVGRFLNADDAEYIGYSGENLSYNAFAYCENNAVNCVDITGFITERINQRLRQAYPKIALNAVLEYILCGRKITQYVEYSRNKNYIYTAIVEYVENKGKHSGKYRKVELTFGNRKQWEDNSKWASNFNDFTLAMYDLCISLAQDVKSKDDYYGVAVPLILLLGMLSGEGYKARQSKNNYDLIWGSKGIDPNNNYGYYLFVVEWQGKSSKEYYVYSFIYNSVAKVVV